MKTVLACAGDLDALIDQLEPDIDDLLELYDELLVATACASPATRERFAQWPGSHLIVVPADDSRRHAVMRASLERNATQMHCADLDHLLRWWRADPSEVRRVVAQVRGCECLLIGRSAQSMRAFPAALHESEAIINTVFSNLLGRDIDTGGGNRGFSRAAAQHVLAHDRDGHPISSDAVWPVLAFRAGFRVETVFVDGLSWSGNDLLEAGSAEEMRVEYDGQAAHWQDRVRLANRIINDGLEAWFGTL
jgi:hypothetical protein